MSAPPLPDFDLDPRLPLGRQFISLGLRQFHAAAEYVWRLPYGRTTDRAEYTTVLAERRGTCSTKHALLAATAREHARPLQLMLGIYEMQERNTPGVGVVLEEYALSCILEAHCYLRVGSVRVDLTRFGMAAEPIERFLLEEEIEPEQIGPHKEAVHEQMLRRWATEHGMSYEVVREARERCIAALGQVPATQQIAEADEPAPIFSAIGRP